MSLKTRTGWHFRFGESLFHELATLCRSCSIIVIIVIVVFRFFCSDVFVVVILHMSIVVAYVVKTLYGYRVNLLRYTSVYPSP